MAGDRYEAALTAIDEANSRDPSGQALVYSRRMSEMLERLAPQAPETVRLAVRAQHVERWKTPRDSYPAGREGYLQWRTHLYGVHAETAGRLLAQAGYDAASIERVKSAVAKKMLRMDPEAQLLEDVVALVFLEHYLGEFAAQHREYDEAKFIDILRKTWRKMSPRAREFALSSGLKIPKELISLVRKAASA
ncbi:MAG TPA: DUF4202 domain-containing protein [Burkholderiales bacterium]